METIAIGLLMRDGNGTPYIGVPMRSGEGRIVGRGGVDFVQQEGKIKTELECEGPCSSSREKTFLILTEITLPSYDPLRDGLFEANKQTLVRLGVRCAGRKFDVRADVAWAQGALDFTKSDFDHDGVTPSDGDRDDFDARIRAERTDREPVTQCGGIQGIPCPSGQFCDLPAGQCWIADRMGVCVEKPRSCPDTYDPVCACGAPGDPWDQWTYTNDCFRLMAGVQKAYDGECQRDQR